MPRIRQKELAYTFTSQAATLTTRNEVGQGEIAMMNLLLNRSLDAYFSTSSRMTTI